MTGNLKRKEHGGQIWFPRIN